MVQPRNILFIDKKKELSLEVYEDIDGLYSGIDYLEQLNNLPTKEKPYLELFELAKERMELGGRDRDLGNKLSAFADDSYFFMYSGIHQIKAQCAVRNTDERHTIASFGYLENICDGEGFTPEEKKKVLSAMICHDCAYPVTKDFLDIVNPLNRIKHMQDGAEAFRCFALQINKNFSDFYNREEIKNIASIIEKHDNPGIGKPFEKNDPQLKLLLAHREADRLWMVDKGGFALDLLRRIVENGQYNPTDYLANVVCKHMKESWIYPIYFEFGNIKFKEYESEKTLYTTDTGFEIFKKSVEGLKSDYKIGKDEYSKCLQRRIHDAKINPGKRED